MSTPTVTIAAPVAAPATPEVQEISIQDRLDHGTAKELDTWRKTGDIPEAKVKPAETSVAAPPKPEAPAAPIEIVDKDQDDEISVPDPEVPAKVEAAPAPEAGRSQKKITAEARLKEVLADRKKDRELLRELTEKLARTPPSVMPPSQPAAEEAKPVAVKAPEASVEPKFDDKGPDGKPLYPLWGDFQSAWSKWVRTEAVREAKAAASEHTTQTQKTQQAAQAEQVIRDNWQGKVVKARASHADFDDVAFPKDADGNQALHIPQGSIGDAFVLDSEYGAEVMYYLGSHLEEAQRIFAYNTDAKGQITGYKMNPLQQARELYKIEAQLAIPVTAKPPVAEVPPSVPQAPPKLPPPPTELSARRSAPVDEAEAALARGDTAGYMRVVNAREIKARKG